MTRKASIEIMVRRATVMEMYVVGIAAIVIGNIAILFPAPTVRIYDCRD